MESKFTMWITLCCIITSELIQFGAEADTVTVTCESCEKKGSHLKGTVGGDLIVKYTVSSPNFRLLTIKYNQTDSIDIAPHVVNTKSVKDQRFSIPKELTENGNNRSIQITLSKLSLKDNGADFTYKYKDANLDLSAGTNTLTVEAASYKSKVAVKDNSDFIIIGVVIGVLIIIMIIIILLLYKGIVSLAWCYELCCYTKKSGDRIPFQCEEKVYDAPHNQSGLSNEPGQREYAALGPGGDHKAKLKEKPKPGYAQVKTDDVNYPSPNFEEPDSIIV